MLAVPHTQRMFEEKVALSTLALLSFISNASRGKLLTETGIVLSLKSFLRNYGKRSNPSPYLYTPSFNYCKRSFFSSIYFVLCPLYWPLVKMFGSFKAFAYGNRFILLGQYYGQEGRPRQPALKCKTFSPNNWCPRLKFFVNGNGSARCGHDALVF